MYDKQLSRLIPHIPVDDTKGIFIAGGALTSIFTNSEINDIDMYFKTKEDAESTLETLINCGYFPIFISKKAITLVKNDEKIQIIYYKYFDSVQSIFNEFDFSVNMAAFDGDSRTIIVSDIFLTSLASRTIEFNENTPYPIISAYRTKKYIEKGYGLSAGSYLKLGLSISRLDIKSWEELDDQVGGIYGELNLKTVTDSEGKIRDFDLNYAIENLESLLDIKISNDFEVDNVVIKEITGFNINSINLGGYVFGDFKL